MQAAEKNMNNNKSYTGIDCFRLIAAYLIVAIHTSPLASVSAQGDFILTRIIARIGVPFFFMTSGFFLISRYSRDGQKLLSFVKKTVSIYALAIVVYIPVNIYNGYFQMTPLLPELIKDILFDGTLYHLWYLPASAIGGSLAWYLAKRSGYKKAFAVTAVLYILGLFGDSYYGFTERIPAFRYFYTLIFQVSDYTRNGIFFAPVFFVLGGFLADNAGGVFYRNGFPAAQRTDKDGTGNSPKSAERALIKNCLGFAVSFALMFGEAMTLHGLGVQRHDSMYVFLLPCMYFLFRILLGFRGRRLTRVRTLSLVIYIIHPLVIVALRLFAKIFHLQELLVENSVAHYLSVCLLSTLAGIVITVFTDDFKPKKRKSGGGTDRAYVEVDLGNLEHNVREIQRIMPEGCQLMAVVKAQAYGHGAYEIAVHLNKMGVGSYSVATIDEGIALRRYGIKGEILILGYTAVSRARELKKYDLTQTLISFEYASLLNKQGIFVKTHLKIDTGMHRLGISWEEFSKVEKVFSMKYLCIGGMFTHFCCADSREPADEAFTRGQIARFYALVEEMKEKGIPVPKLHMQSSYGLLNYPELSCDYVRIGIALYGVFSSPGDDTLIKPDLRPVLSLKCRVTLVRNIKAGESVGYGRAYTAERESRIALLSIGYADGYPRALSCGRGQVLINGQAVPVAGRVCMDQLAVDVTDAGEVTRGDVATLIGMEEDGGVSAPAIADNAGSISNELLCRMGGRLPVIVKI